MTSKRRLRGIATLLCFGCGIFLVRLFGVDLLPPAGSPSFLSVSKRRSEGFLRLGTHVILELGDTPFDILNSTTLIRTAMLEAASAGSLTVIGEQFHSFPVMGLSGILVISESHLSMHTWPEHGYAAVDLFTCGPRAEAFLPCGPMERMRYEGNWTCANGSAAVLRVDSGLWAAVVSLIKAVRAGSATMLWMERGVNGKPRSTYENVQLHAAGSDSKYGLLGGLERASRPEL
mmetsp:Transcript_4839/g.11821  ORF Transcript_4839/g.11821 Transcript_4839/m.11821 type:complete len:232 (+) Transcript_4839:78-773(+)